jgi:shikimate dehydrogenase
MHNAAITALGLNAVYVALRVPVESLAAVLDTCRVARISGNLTLPLKEAAARYLDDVTPLARALGAVNVFWTDGEALRGDNTDVAGVDEALRSLDAPPPWLLCGTGGAARAVAAVAVRRGVPLLVRSRRPERAGEFVAWARTLAPDVGTGQAALRTDDGHAAVGTVVSATPQGLSPDGDPPVAPQRWRAAAAALDLAYRPGETGWIRACRAAGLRAADGRTVLVAQGAHAFTRFFPETTPPREIMRAAVERALAQ